MEIKETIVISLGGSLIVPDGIDTEFLRGFQKMIEGYVAAGKRFVIITGGGKVCRRYQKAATELTSMSKEELDWIGIHVTRLNGNFLRILFKDLAHGEVVLDPTVLVETTKPVVIGAGWKPGWSTDYDAVEMAERVGAKMIINLSNIDFAYDKDPRKFPDAKKIESITWANYRALLPKEWDPGLSTPFDPIASKRAEELGLHVAIMNGQDLSNVQNCIEDKHFSGTHIHP